MDYDDALGHMAMLLSEYRARALEADAQLHNLEHAYEQQEIQNLYLRRIIGFTYGIKTPRAEDIDPNFGPWSREALHMPPPSEMEDPDENGNYVEISGPAIHEEGHAPHS